MPIYELDGQGPDLPIDGHFFIADTAAVIGKVRLKQGASVWFGAVLRGDNEWIELGEGSNIQDNCTCHTDAGFPLTIGKNCTIGHNAILHGCTVEDGALIGMGAIVLNGALIRRGSIVGAGSVVTTGKEFPENSLIIGSPARVIRTLKPDQISTVTPNTIRRGVRSTGRASKRSARETLVSRFRSSHHFAASPFASFVIEGH
jgi:carbonic anhydrase/acetyltransferase-like protein (isoleucine patch superfamily)